MNTTYLIIAVAVGLLLGLSLTFLLKIISKAKYSSAEREAGKVIDGAKKDAEKIIKEATLEAKDIAYQSKSEIEKELKERRNELSQLDKRLRNKEENIERKTDNLEKREREMTKRERDFTNKENGLTNKEKFLDETIEKQKEMLENISNMSAEQAMSELLKRVEEESRFEAAKLLKQIEEETKELSQKKAREIISNAIQRYASDYVADVTVSNVSLPSDEMKGRIIGREGRNIRSLEAATGVDFIVDDTPEVVTLSAFDPVRREIARVALERLIADGRIHPTRVEEVVGKVKKEINMTIREEGEKAVFDLGLSGFNSDLIRLIGRLKYRTSYGQNILQHSREVAYLAGIMAGELGVNEKLAKRAGLLHDIGKAVDHEVEGPHHEIGANIAKKHGENAKVINAIAVHHGDGEPTCIESALVAAADALSAARPGVRKESMENYIKRLQKLEEMANSVSGVDKSYAIQAGREVRILVKPEEVSDDTSALISADIAKKIESELSYPGQIKVTVIRESRFVEYAK
ncbi:MAG: ribonuclease Y [Nitrospirota bacterium]|nr:MAG: ribonuclease Y [Nitrospirota bacterium]